MARADGFGLDHQLWNQLLEDKNSLISYQDGYLSMPEGSFCRGSLNFSNPVVQMPYQSAPHVPASINIVQSNQINSGTSSDENSLITCQNSLLYGGSYSREFGLNRIESPASVSGCSNVSQLSPEGHYFSVPAHKTSDSPVMMLKSPTVETMQEEPLLPNSPSQMALWQAMGRKCYTDRVTAARMLRETQNPHHPEYPSSSNSPNIQPSPGATVHPQQAYNAVIDAGVALQRLKSYVHYRRERPSDNNICYWRSFVRHYFSPHAKKKTCFSKYAHCVSHARGVFSLENTWKCKICESTSGKGFVETFEVLPRLNQLYFNSVGVSDELLYLEISKEKRLPDGSLIVCFGKAVQESIYEHCRVVHEGKLQVIFTPQLQIISWDFCVQNYEVLLPRRLIAAQVNDFIKGTTRRRSIVGATGHARVQEQNWSSNNNRVAAAARKLATMVEEPLLSDLGLSKHFVRNLQVSELMNTMKDLMMCTLNNKTGPIETLKQYGRKCSNTKPVTRRLELRSPVQPSSGPSEYRNYPARNVHLVGKIDPTFQAASYMVHTPNSPIMPAMHPTPYNKAPPSFSSSHQGPISPTQSSLDPASARSSLYVEKFVLNDLLAHFQQGGSERARSDLNGGAQKKLRVNTSQVDSEGAVDQIAGCKGGNSKGLNSSCSSNSPRTFPVCNFLKRDRDLNDEDFTSPAQIHGFSKHSNDHR